MKDENSLVQMESLFLALSDKTRLRILNLMREGEICVGYFTEVLGEGQPKISRHLAYLRNAGIVFARREGKWIYYRIEFPQSGFAVNILRETLEWLDSQEDLREDYRKLLKIYDLETVSNKPASISEKDVSAYPNMRMNKKEELDTFLL